MFTGLVQTTGTVTSIADGRLRAGDAPSRSGWRGRLRRGERRVPHRHRRRGQRLRRRRDGRDPAPHRARRPRPGRHGEPRAAAARGRPPGRPHRAGPRRRHRRPSSRSPRRASRGWCGSPPAEDLLRYVVEKGSIARRRRVAHRRRGRRRRLLGLADPRDARAHDARRRSSRARQVNLEVDVIAKYVEKLVVGTRSDERLALQHHRGGARGRPRREDGGGLRRRGPRERGRPHAAPPSSRPRRPINFMAKHGARADLPGAHPRPLRRAGPRPDGGQERVAASRPPSRSRSRRARASPPASPRTTARARSRSRSTRARRPRDLVQPGHIFPLKAKEGGVLERTGQTEAARRPGAAGGPHAGRA